MQVNALFSNCKTKHDVTVTLGWQESTVYTLKDYALKYKNI